MMMKSLGKASLIALIAFAFSVPTLAQSEGYMKASSYLQASSGMSAKSKHRNVAGKKKHKKKKHKH
jgi:hypothetical protein